MLIGSRALKYHIPNFPIRDNSDWDFIGKQTCDVPNGDRVEIHSLDLLNNKDAVELYNINGVCTLHGLTKIKRSHLHRDLKFDKHITDYHKWLKPNDISEHNNHDYVWHVKNENFLKNRIALTKKEYPVENPNLNQSNSDFFDDAVDKKYDHDWLHSLYAYLDKPIYEYLKYENKEDSAWCEKELWDKLPMDHKIKCVSEETYVIATERFLVPSKYEKYPQLCYFMALRKVCTTLTSGWFRDFAIDFYPDIVKMYDINKINHVRSFLEE